MVSFLLLRSGTEVVCMSIKMIFIFGVLALSARAARADEHRHWGGRRVEWHGGHWIHDRHGGRLGWWWVVGPTWYFYERPHSFVVQQAPPPVIVQQVPVAPPAVVMQQPQPAPVSPVLYYCRATGTHYPETMSCPGGWSIMTAEAPPQQ